MDLYLSGTQDRQGVFRPIAFQITTSENAENIAGFLKSIDLWVQALFGESLFDNVKHTMSDQSGAILNALQTLMPSAKRHVCWFHIAQALKNEVPV